MRLLLLYNHYVGNPICNLLSIPVTMIISYSFYAELSSPRKHCRKTLFIISKVYKAIFE